SGQEQQDACRHGRADNRAHQHLTGVWSRISTRAQPVSTTSGARSIHHGLTRTTRLATVPAATAAWIEIFQKDVTASVTTSPATIETTSANRACGASSQSRTSSPAATETSATAI